MNEVNMDTKTKNILGFFLGEIYEIKCLLKGTPVDKAKLYGLKNGFESVINDYIEEDWGISKEDENTVAKILDPYFCDDAKLNELKGFYDIESELEEKGISRLKARAIMKYFYSKGRFLKVLKKMDSSFSPQECRTFEITEFDI